jgi:hypothetical protein
MYGLQHAIYQSGNLKSTKCICYHSFDYYEQLLEPVVALVFQGLLGYRVYRAKQEMAEECGLYLDHVTVHWTKKVLTEEKRVLEGPLHECRSSSRA